MNKYIIELRLRALELDMKILESKAPSNFKRAWVSELFEINRMIKECEEEECR
jgi:hypothetical protein